MYTFKLNQLKGLILSLLHFSSIGNASRSHWFLQILKLVLQVSLFGYFLNFCLQKKSMPSLPYNPWNWNILRTF